MKIEEKKGKGGMGLTISYYLYLGLRRHVSCVLLTRLGIIRRGTKEDSLTEVFSFSSFFHNCTHMYRAQRNVIYNACIVYIQ